MLSFSNWQEQGAFARFTRGQSAVQYNMSIVASCGDNIKKKIKELENRKRRELAMKYPDSAWIARCDKILVQLRQNLKKYTK